MVSGHHGWNGLNSHILGLELPKCVLWEKKRSLYHFLLLISHHILLIKSLYISLNFEGKEHHLSMNVVPIFKFFSWYLKILCTLVHSKMGTNESTKSLWLFFFNMEFIFKAILQLQQSTLSIKYRDFTYTPYLHTCRASPL